MRSSVVRSAVELPARIYQSNRDFLDRAALAAGWTGLYVLGSEGVYRNVGAGAVPVEWQILIGAFVFICGLAKPVAAYAAFVVAMAYPLYLISVYVMALALAVLILAAVAVFRHMDFGALALALLILAVPVLAPFHLTALPPLLAGLWWGATGGGIGGGLGAVWLKICASMAGYPADLWGLNGWTLRFGPVYERFHAANSMQTIVRLARPFWSLIAGPASVTEGDVASYAAGTVLLYHVLQVVAWAAAGYLVGAIWTYVLGRRVGGRGGLSADRYARRRAVTGGAGTSALAASCIGPGALAIWASYVAVPAWLNVGSGEWWEPPWLPAQIVWMCFVAWLVDSGLRYLRRPLLPASWYTSARDRERATVSRASAPTRKTAEYRVGSRSRWPRWLGRRSRAGRPSAKARRAEVRARDEAARPVRQVRRGACGDRQALHGDERGVCSEGGAAADIMIELD